jgi:hypothetical protein
MRGVQAIEGVVFRITIARRASVWQLTQSVLKKWLRAESAIKSRIWRVIPLGRRGSDAQIRC